MLHNLFFQIWLCTQIGDHQPKDLTKFGYRPIMQVIYFVKSSYISANYWKLLFVKIWLFEKKIRNLLNLGIVFTKILSTCQNRIFR
jgi:hypothetical protein